MSTELADNEVFCRDCGATINERAEICPECGIRQREPPGADSSAVVAGDSQSWFDQYTLTTWIVSIIFGLLTFPVGLLIPAYFFIKASRSEPPNQGPWEVWTVILLGIFGIIAVEAGGEKGAKVLWGIVGVAFAFFFLLILALF